MAFEVDPLLKENIDHLSYIEGDNGDMTHYTTPSRANVSITVNEGPLSSSHSSIDTTTKPIADASTDEISKGVAAFIFIAFSILTGLCPVIYQWVLMDPITGIKEVKFVPCMAHAFAYTFNAIGSALTMLLFSNTTEAWKWITDKEAALEIAPAVFCNSMSDAGEVVAMKFLDGGVRAVLNQIRLPIVTSIKTVCHGVRHTLQQWLLIISVSGAVVAFVLSKAQVVTSLSELKWGICIALGVILFGVTGATTADPILGRPPRRPINFYLWRIRSVGTLFIWIITLIGAFGFMGKNIWNLFEGITYRFFILVGFLALRDVFYIATLSYLDALKNGLGNCVAVSVAFTADIVIFHEPFRWQSFILVVLVLNLVCAYLLAPAPKHKKVG